MNRDDIVLKLIEGVDNFLTKANNACLVALNDADVVNLISAVDSRANVIMNVLSGPGNGGGPGGGGPGGGPDSGPSVIGTIVEVAVAGDLITRALVLGNTTAPASTLPTGVGNVQPYQGGVTLTNAAGADVFVAPLDRVREMSPSGVMDKLVGEGSTLALEEVVADVSIQPGETITLVPRK